ncbi:MAG: isoprenylcysteine carboxylmethyltransferase family protein [Caldilineaceae bacterium]|nr:isoprenylcysteine carboxylmethyltransferase family protein [Caldilineaceae bacterium]
MGERGRSLALVAIQFACLGVIAWTGPLLARSPIALLLELGGMLLGLWAILAMGPGNFNVTPEVRVDGRFIAKGPYRLIRHPMYAALLLVAGALVFNHFTWFRLVVWIILAADLLLKLHYEESLLRVRFGEYPAYAQRSWRLVPFIY